MQSPILCLAVLDKKFTVEPFYIDLRTARTQKDLSLNNPIFKKEVLKLAAQLHNKEPKDLAGEEVAAHRKMIRIRNAAITHPCFSFYCCHCRCLDRYSECKRSYKRKKHCPGKLSGLRSAASSRQRSNAGR